jgi:ketosteroid isomerase-like protein
MKTLIYASSQECEIAFYRAFDAADLSAMMAVWAEEDDIVCVHPGGPRLAGIDAVRESWRQIFASGPGLRVRPTQPLVTSTLQTAIHTLHENLSAPGESRPFVPMIATNIYLRTERGWRLHLHHASPAPEHPPAGDAGADAGPPPILH